MTGAPLTLTHVFRRAAAPLGWYYLVTLVLPVANGAAQSGGAFARHALVVLLVPPMLIACGWAIHHTVAACASRR